MPEEGRKYVQVAASLAQDVVNVLDQMAEKQNRSRSYIIRDAVAAYLLDLIEKKAPGSTADIRKLAEINNAP